MAVLNRYNDKILKTTLADLYKIRPPQIWLNLGVVSQLANFFCTAIVSLTRSSNHILELLANLLKTVVV